jgi:hypothetical protein
MNRDSLPGPVIRHPAIAALLVGLSLFVLFDWSSSDRAANRQNSPPSNSVDLSPFSHGEELPHR